ncbi:hypothetical protein GWI33_003697 [Rhynchophorus ferrugineus]|nr:hypothetical protein GWI33_003697 [Rhynchophorus ferrugineus]
MLTAEDLNPSAEAHSIIQTVKAHVSASHCDHPSSVVAVNPRGGGSEGRSTPPPCLAPGNFTSYSPDYLLSLHKLI